MKYNKALVFGAAGMLGTTLKSIADESKFI